MNWQKTSGYNRRSKVEAAIGRYKRVIGDAMCSREDARRLCEVKIAVKVLNQTSPTDGVGDAKLLKSLECSIKGRHYRGWRSRGFSAAPGRDFRRRLSGKLELQLSKQEQLILFRLSITGQDDHPIVRRGQFDIDHLHAGEFFEHDSGVNPGASTFSRCFSVTSRQ